MKRYAPTLARTLLPLFLAVPGLALPGGEPEAEALDLQPLQGAAPGPAEDGFMSAVLRGDYWVDMNLRYAWIDEDGLNKDASALTLRAAVGYRTGKWHNLSGMIEVEAVQAFVTDYNSGVNGKTQYPFEPDPQSGEINQGYLDWGYVESGKARLGRQEIALDNQRFVGNVPWRQNYQSFDAGAIDQDFAEHGNVFVAYVDNVNGVLGDNSPNGNFPMQSILSNASWDFENWGKLSAYWYNLDYNSAVALSSSTVGGRFNGEHAVGESSKITYTLEYAAQAETGDNPNNLDADYSHAKLGGVIGAVDAVLGYEILGGSNNAGGQFRTPLATLHKFNGWADKFLFTPPEGLQDLYVGLGGRAAKWRFLGVYHDFQSDLGSDDYGSEINLLATRPINEVFAFGAKYANYMEADYAPALDTQKFWIWLSASI